MPLHYLSLPHFSNLIFLYQTILLKAWSVTCDLAAMLGGPVPSWILLKAWSITCDLAAMLGGPVPSLQSKGKTHPQLRVISAGDVQNRLLKSFTLKGSGNMVRREYVSVVNRKSRKWK